MSVYIHLFHGRKTLEENLDDWGSDGPIIGPLNYVHVTYMDSVRGECPIETAEKFFPDVYAEEQEFANKNHRFMSDKTDFWLDTPGDCILYDGVYYGDWTITTSPTG